jgi:hypothetical protein
MSLSIALMLLTMGTNAAMMHANAADPASTTAGWASLAKLYIEGWRYLTCSWRCVRGEDSIAAQLM